MQKPLIGLGIAFLVIIVIFIGSGGFSFLKAKNMMPSLENFIDQLYQRFNIQDYSYIYNQMADEKFKTVNSYQSYEGFMRGVYQKLGRVKQWKRGAWNIKYNLSNKVKFTVEYTATRDKGITIDTFLLRNYKGSWLLISYNINPKDSN